MNNPRIDNPVSSEPAALSRRTMVGAGATGLALALLARSYQPGSRPGRHAGSARRGATRGEHHPADLGGAD